MVELGALLLVPSAPHTTTQLNPAKTSDSASGWVLLGCTNPGSQQDTAKTPLVKNTTRAPIPRGRSLWWTASDGDAGSVTLGQDLPPGDTVQGVGKRAPAYTCTAKFYAGPPDLVVVRANLGPAPTADVRNTNAWIDAGPLTVKFELRRCSDNRVLSMGRAGPLAVPAATCQKFVPMIKPPAKPARSHWRITVDFEKRVSEADESNNVWSNRSACSR